MSEEKKSGSWQDTVSDWLISIIVAVVLAFGIRTFLVEPLYGIRTFHDEYPPGPGTAAGEQTGLLHPPAQTGGDHRIQVSQ